MTDRPTAASTRPEVSVIVPAYNAGASIRTAVGSVLAEPVDLECLVVDDGSSDDTAAIVESIAAGDPRVILLRQPENAGVSAARNRALETARGEWISFVDADDRLLPGALATMLAAAREEQALVVLGRRVSTDGTRTWYPSHHQGPDLWVPGRKSLLRNPGLLYNAGPVAKLYHRSCADGLRFVGRSLGDQPWVLKATLRAGDHVLVIPDTVYEWRRPAADRSPSTITADRERSVDRAIEGVAMAGVAWRDVTAAWAPLAEPAQRHALDVAYLDRLVLADLARQLVNAVLRRDAGCGRLLDALARELAALPPDVVLDARAPGDRLVRPTIAFWWRLPADARPAFASLLAAARTSGVAGGRRPRSGILRNPGTRLLPLGGLRGLAGLALAWPHAVGSLGLERIDRRFRGIRFT